MKLALNGRKPTLLESSYTDLGYMIASNQINSSLILACSTLEVARDNLLELNKKSLPGSDLPRHLSSDFERLFDRNLKNEDGELFNFLRGMWIARGNVAHGKELIWRIENKNIDTPVEYVLKIPLMVKKILAWIKSIDATQAQ